VFRTLDEIVEKIRQSPKLIIADDFELSVQRITSQSDRFLGGATHSQIRDDSWWLGLRLLHRKRPGRSAVMLTSPESIPALIETAFESAKASSPDPWFRFPLWKTPKLKRTRADVESPSSTYLDSLFHEVESLCVAADLQFEEVHEHREVDTLLYRKSEKFQLAHFKQIHATHFSLSHASASLRLRETRASTAEGDCRRPWLAHFLSRVPEIEDASMMSGQETCPVILSPFAAVELLRLLAPWLGADAIQSGRSPLAGNRDRIFSEALTLIDDGTLDFGVETVPFDMEGCLTQRTVLIERGRLKGSLYDAYTATRENRISTGNFMRGASRKSPAIAPTNFYLEPSPAAAESLVESLEDGILIDAFDRLEEAPGGGITEFVFEGTGCRIRHGQREKTLRAIRGRVDLLELLSRAVMVGDDLNFYGNLGSPSILFDRVTLGM
jgi:predicted Zn-dependent protease